MSTAALALSDLVSSDVGATVLCWLCLEDGNISVHSAARTLCALRRTCTKFARDWHDADVLGDLLSGRSRPGDFTAEQIGGFAHQPWLLERVDAALGPRVPEDHATIAAALEAAAAMVTAESVVRSSDGGTASAGPGGVGVTVRVAAGRYTITTALDMPAGVRLVGSCATGEAVIEVVGCVGVHSTAWDTEIVNLTFRTGSGDHVEDRSSGPVQQTQDVEDDPQLEEDPGRQEDAGDENDHVDEWGSCHCIYIRAGNLLLKDCDISCMSGCGVAIVCDQEAASSRPDYNSDDPPRLLRCTVHDGGDVGVYIQGTSATLIDCTVKDHSLSNVELLRSGPEMQLRGCKIEGGHEAGLHCCEASSAVLTDCHIFSSGMAGLAAQEAAKINLHRCTIRSGWEGGVMAMGKDTAVELQECIISFNTEVGIEAKQQACICLKKSTVRSNGTAGVLSRLEGQVHIDKCRVSDNGLAGVEVREKGIAQVNDSVLYGKSPKSAARQNDKDCSPQSLPAFLTSHDSVGAGLFVHRGGELLCTGSTIERHRSYGAKLSREGTLRLSKCTVQKNRHGVTVDTQTALSVGDAIDMTAFHAHPDWPHPPHHSSMCNSSDKKGKEKWIAPLSTSLSGAGSRTVTAIADINGCAVQNNWQEPQLAWYGQGGCLLLDGARRDTHFGDGDVDAAVTAAEEARRDTLPDVHESGQPQDLTTRVVRAWAMIAQHDDPGAGQEGCDQLFEHVVQLAGLDQDLEIVSAASLDDNLEDWPDLTDAYGWSGAAVVDGGRVNVLAPWARVVVQVASGTLKIFRRHAERVGNGSEGSVNELGERLSRIDTRTSIKRPERVGMINDNDRDTFRLNECSVRTVCRPSQGPSLTGGQISAQGVLVQEQHALGKQCWLMLGDTPAAWVATCILNGAGDR